MSRYTPLPPIAAPDEDDDSAAANGETPNNEDDDDDADTDLYNVPEYNLKGQSLDDIFAELSRIFPEMEKKVKVKHAAYLGAVGDKCRSIVNGDKLGRHLVSLNFVELFQRYWGENFTKVAVSNPDHVVDWYTAYSLLLVMWNMSDKCNAVCERILKVQLHSDLLNFMKSDQLHPSCMDEERPSSIVQAFIGIMHNLVQRATGARESMRACDAVDRLQPFRKCTNAMVSCVSLMIQSYLVTEAENEKINSGDDVFKLLIKLLDAAIKQESHMGVNFAAIEVLEVLNKLAANDNNKYRIVRNGALPYYVDLMSAQWTPREHAETAHGLWILAFKCKDQILDQPGCIEALKNLLKSPEEKVRKEAEGALWILEEKNEPVPKELKDTRGVGDIGDGHIFISYQWDAKSTVLKIRDRLKATGFRVWIDEDEMTGSVLDAMATAVEKAAIVIICLSQKYKESPNCRTEAEYTFRLKKKIIPLRIQPKYYPDGWLGIMVGSKLVFDFSDQAKAQENMKNLVKDLGDRGKETEGQDETDFVKSVSVPVTNALNYANHEKTSPINFWTEEDVSKWVMDSNLERVKDWFSSFTGPLLLEYNAMRLDAPEAFFAYLMKKDVALTEALAISQALKSL